MRNKTSTLLAVITLLGALGAPNTRGVETVQLTITGGHETVPADHGRPVVLIASALGVKPEVFRTAFSRVMPAPGGTKPTAEQVRQNKEARLVALSPYGVTNELLDRVSDYYRYRPESGKLWDPARGRLRHSEWAEGEGDYHCRFRFRLFVGADHKLSRPSGDQA